MCSWHLDFSLFVFFFFKQKTAYEMRISDWSSDVCSSDLSLSVLENVQMALLSHRRKVYSFWRAATSRYRTEAMQLLEQVGMHEQADRACSELAYGDVKRVELAMSRSEEHTSELQSLMRNSYAVFCLKKKKSNRMSKPHHYTQPRKGY